MAYNTTTLLDSKVIPQDSWPAGAEMTGTANDYREFRPQPVRSPPRLEVGSSLMTASAEPGNDQIMWIISTIEPPGGLGEGSAATKNPGLRGRGLSGQMSVRLRAASPVGDKGEQVEDVDGSAAVEVRRAGRRARTPRRQEREQVEDAHVA